MTEVHQPSSEGAPPACPDLRPHVRRLSPVEASDYLATTHGTPVAIATLAKFRCIGGGPRFGRFGRSIFYERTDLDAWVWARLSGTLTSTSDGNGAR